MRYGLCYSLRQPRACPHSVFGVRPAGRWLHSLGRYRTADIPPAEGEARSYAPSDERAMAARLNHQPLANPVPPSERRKRFLYVAIDRHQR